MACLPPEQQQEEGVPSAAFPPNMENIMNLLVPQEIPNPDGTQPIPSITSPNIDIIEQVEDVLNNLTPTEINALPIDQQDLINGTYNFSGNSQFDKFTTPYNPQFQPLLPNSGGIQTVLDLLRTHLLGNPNTIPGDIGSLGSANFFRTLSFSNSENALRLGLGQSTPSFFGIPDCGLFNLLMGALQQLLEPLIALLSALLGPLIDLISFLLGILGTILNELLKLIGLLASLLGFSNAGSLLNLNPCALLGAAGSFSEDLVNEVNDGITWNDPNAPTIPHPDDIGP